VRAKSKGHRKKAERRATGRRQIKDSDNKGEKTRSADKRHTGE
jgi:hypothetical protein